MIEDLMAEHNITLKLALDAGDLIEDLRQLKIASSSGFVALAELRRELETRSMHPSIYRDICCLLDILIAERSGEAAKPIE
jgi:hypothetical protein